MKYQPNNGIDLDRIDCCEVIHSSIEMDPVHITSVGRKFLELASLVIAAWSENGKEEEQWKCPCCIRRRGRVGEEEICF